MNLPCGHSGSGPIDCQTEEVRTDRSGGFAATVSALQAPHGCILLHELTETTRRAPRSAAMRGMDASDVHHSSIPGLDPCHIGLVGRETCAN